MDIHLTGKQVREIKSILNQEDPDLASDFNNLVVNLLPHWLILVSDFFRIPIYKITSDNFVFITRGLKDDRKKEIRAKMFQ
jgi:hypothetical protein